MMVNVRMMNVSENDGECENVKMMNVSENDEDCTCE